MVSNHVPMSADDFDRADDDIETGRYQLLDLRYSLKFQRVRFLVLVISFVVMSSAVLVASIGRFMFKLNIRMEFSSELSTAFAILGIFLVFELGSACVVAAAALFRGRRLESELERSLHEAEEALESESSWNAA